MGRGLWVEPSLAVKERSWVCRTDRRKRAAAGPGGCGTRDGRSKECPRFFPDLAVYAIVVMVSLGGYVNSLEGDFVHDDIVAVTSNPDVLGKTSLVELFVNDFWGKPMADPSSHKSYRPLTVLTFRLNRIVGGLAVYGFHIVNLWLHLVVVLLLTCLCRDILLWGREDVATAGLLFATHPIHTEAVSSIVGRAEVLSAVFFLASFLCFTRCTSSTTLRRETLGWLALSMLFATLALLAKEQGITVLPVCVFYHVLVAWERHKKFKKFKPLEEQTLLEQPDIRIVTAVCVLTLLITLRLWMLQGSMPRFSEQDNPASFSSSVLTRLCTYCYLAAFNAWLLLAPMTLSYDWQMGSIPLVDNFWDVRNLMSVALGIQLAAMLWCALITSKKSDRRTLFVSLCVFVLPYLPASNLFVTVGFVVAERVLYIPSAGFCMLVTFGLRRLRDHRPELAWLWRLLTLLLLLTFLARTVRRNDDWTCRERLFRSGIESVPQNAKVHYNYANLQKDIGSVDTAIKHYLIALRLWPNHASAHNNLGTLLTNTEDAEYHFKAALSINPTHSRALFNLACLYSKQGHTQIAINLLQKVIQLDSQFAEAYSSLAHLHAEFARLEEAEELHQTAIRVDPESADAYNNYGTFLQKTGRVEEAVDQYRMAIRLQPNHTVAIVNAARSLRALSNTEEAEYLYKRALAIHEDPKIMDNLGVLYLTAGRIKEARQLYDEMQIKYADYVEGKVHYAQVLMQERSYDLAENALLTVIQENATHRDAFHQLSVLYSHINRTTEAMEYILKALSLCDAADMSCAQLHADHGDILKDLSYLDDAAQSYAMAIQLDPTLPHAHFNLAVIKHLQGECHQALKYYHEAYALDPDNQLLIENMKKLKRHLLDGCNVHQPPSCRTR